VLSLTDCGLPGVRRIPYGVHMCHFYERREDLVAALVPYFAAGLRNRERCIWITAEPLYAEQAKRELRNAGLNVDAAVRKEALAVMDYSDWYARSGKLKGTEVVGQWLAAEQGALARGYNGLRITGNLSFLTPQALAGVHGVRRSRRQGFPRPPHRHALQLPSRRLRGVGSSRRRASPRLRAGPPGQGLADPHRASSLGAKAGPRRICGQPDKFFSSAHVSVVFEIRRSHIPAFRGRGTVFIQETT